MNEAGVALLSTATASAIGGMSWWLRTVATRRSLERMLRCALEGTAPEDRVEVLRAAGSVLNGTPPGE